MTDLHCHILHDIDDGPADLCASLEMCRIALDNQIERVVATPHFADYRHTDDIIGRRDERLKELRQALAAHEMALELFPGAEVLICDEAFRAGCLRRLTINGSRYLLVEFARSDPDAETLAGYLAELHSLGLIPILAHPERYRLFQRDDEALNSLMRKGAVIQVNAACLSGRRAENRLARELVRRRAVSFLATDAHSAAFRPNNLLDMLGRLSQDIDYDYLDAMVHRNPDAVLQDKDLYTFYTIK